MVGRPALLCRHRPANGSALRSIQMRSQDCLDRGKERILGFYFLKCDDACGWIIIREGSADERLIAFGKAWSISEGGSHWKYIFEVTTEYSIVFEHISSIRRIAPE